ncbi:MAG: hypothetical protein SF028_14710 [Candidatus Sumerlaeia bacterium]|nr:hypothetical protein [Candidatus Sumerlaeia bacterium]
MTAARPRAWVRVVRVLAAIAVGFTLVFSAALLLLQRRLIYFPQPYPVQRVEDLLPAGGRALEYQLRGARQFAYWVPGPAATDESPIVAVFSGNASLAALGWSDWIDEAREADPSLSFLLVEYPGYGRSGLEPTRANIIAATMGAWDRLAEELGLERPALDARAAAMGHSLGAAAAMEFATRVRPRRIVLFAPFVDIKRIARRTVGPLFQHLLLDRFDNAARLREYLPAQPEGRVLVFHAEDDNILEAGFSRELHAAHPQAIELVISPTGGHDGILATHRDRAVEFLAGE